MFTKETYEEALEYFLKEDKPFYNLLEKHGHLNDAPDLSLFVTMTKCILTQWVYLKKSNKVRAKLLTLLGTDFGAQDIITLGAQGLIEFGTNERIAETAVNFAEYFQKNSVKTIDDIYNINMSGIGVWTKNVCALCFSLGPQYPDPPYNALTTGDPVVRKGIWVLHGIEAYNSYIRELNERHAPWGGILTWYLWREFNFKKIPVPKSYMDWNRESAPRNCIGKQSGLKQKGLKQKGLKQKGFKQKGLKQGRIDDFFNI